MAESNQDTLKVNKLESIANIRRVRNIAPVKQGALYEIARGEEDIKQLLMVNERPIVQMNSVRLEPLQTSGMHYHPEIKDERIMVGYGMVRITLENPQNRERFEACVQQGEIADLPRGLAHRYYNPSQTEYAIFIELATMAFDPAEPQKDTIPYIFQD